MEIVEGHGSRPWRGTVENWKQSFGMQLFYFRLTSAMQRLLALCGPQAVLVVLFRGIFRES